MFNNARTYNQEGSFVWNDAEELQRVFDATLAEVQQELNTSDMEASTDIPSVKNESRHTEVMPEAISEADELAETRPKVGMKIKLSMGRRKRT